MLRLIIVVKEDFDEATSEFVEADTIEIELEHSLVSLSKWECKWEKPFLGDEERTHEELLDYIQIMIIGEIPTESVLSRLSSENVEQIQKYINARMTATWFNDRHEASPFKEVVTAEIIYYWMISLGVPFDCQYWHLNRLLTLIKVCSIKNQPAAKMSKQETGAMQHALNMERRRATGSKG